MNRLEEELAYVEKDEIDNAERLREGKKLLAVWLLFRMRALKKAGWSDRVILQDMEFEARKVV